MSTDNDNTSSDYNEDERRQMLRVEGTAIIELNPLPNVIPLHDFEKSDETEYLLNNGFDPREDKLFYLMRELQTIDMQTNSAFNSLQAQAPELATCLEAINQKINNIGETLCDDMFDASEELQAIDLSTGGIGFNHTERLAENSIHAMKLWFDHSRVGICAHIKVLACNRSISGGFHISAMFASIGETDLRIIQRHIAQVEAQMRRDAAALRTALDKEA